MLDIIFVIFILKDDRVGIHVVPSSHCWHYANFGIVSQPAPQTHASGSYSMRYHGGQLKKNQPCYRHVLIFKI